MTSCPPELVSSPVFYLNPLQDKLLISQPPSLDLEFSASRYQRCSLEAAGIRSVNYRFSHDLEVGAGVALSIAEIRRVVSSAFGSRGRGGASSLNQARIRCLNVDEGSVSFLLKSGRSVDFSCFAPRCTLLPPYLFQSSGISSRFNSYKMPSWAQLS